MKIYVYIYIYIYIYIHTYMYTYTLFSHTHTRTPLPRENCTRAETRAGERAEGRSEERRCKDGKSVCALFFRREKCVRTLPSARAPHLLSRRTLPREKRAHTLFPSVHLLSSDLLSARALFSFESRVRAQRQDQKREEKFFFEMCTSSVARRCAHILFLKFF